MYCGCWWKPWQREFLCSLDHVIFIVVNTETEETEIRNDVYSDVEYDQDVNDNDDRINVTVVLFMNDGKDDHSEQTQTLGLMKHYLRLHKE